MVVFRLQYVPLYILALLRDYWRSPVRLRAGEKEISVLRVRIPGEKSKKQKKKSES